jgi:hypothetical protein
LLSIPTPKAPEIPVIPRDLILIFLSVPIPDTSSKVEIEGYTSFFYFIIGELEIEL